MKLIRPRRFVLASSAASLLAAAFAHAVDYNFAPATGTVTWNDGANWNTLPVDDGNFPSLAGDLANLIKDLTGATTVNLNADITLGQLNLGDNAGGAQTLTLGNTGGTRTITFDNGGTGATLLVANAGGGNVTVNNNFLLADDLTFTPGNRQIQLSGTGTTFDTAGHTLTFSGTGAGTVLFGAFNTTSASITGGGDVVVNMGNTTASIALFGQNTFTGGVTLQGGQLVPGRSTTGVDGGVSVGALGTGTLTITGAGAFTTRIVRPSTNANFTIGNSVAANADFTIGTSPTATSLNMSGTMTLGGNRVIGAEGGSNNHIISGVIADGGGGFGITKAGAGALRLSGASTYSGVTRVGTGALFVHGDALVSTPGPLGNANSAIELGSSGVTAAGSALALRGGVDGMTIARDIVVTNLNPTGFSNIGNDTTQNVTFSGNIALSRDLGLSSRGATGIVDVTGVISGGAGIVVLDGGMSRLSGVNTYSGATTVRNGTLIAAGNVAPGVDGVLGNSATAIVLADASSAAANNVTLNIGGAFEISRDVTVNGFNSTGTTRLTASNPAATTATYSGLVNMVRNTTLANETAGAITRFTNVISDLGNARGIIIAGAGTVEFAGTASHDYTGVTTVASGTLLLNATPGLGLGGGAIIGDSNTATIDIAIVGGTLRWAANHQVQDDVILAMSSGTLDLAGFTETIFDFDYTGGAIVNASGLTITNGTDLFLFDGTTIGTPLTLNRRLLYVGSTTQAAVNAQIALDADPNHDFSVNDGAAAVDLVISGSIVNDTLPSSITKRGAGVLLLSGVNTFGGGGSTVTIEGGKLAVTADNQLGDSANEITFTGGTLRFDASFSTARTINILAGGGIETSAGVTATIPNPAQIAGNSTFTKSGPGVLAIMGDQSLTWTGGALAITGGTVEVSAGNQLGVAAVGVVFNGGRLRVTSGFTADPARVFTVGAGGGGFQVDAAQTLVLGGTGQVTGSGVLSKEGAGTLSIGGANVGIATGAGVMLTAGTLELRNVGALGTTNKAAIAAGGGTLALAADTASSFGNPLTVNGDMTLVSDVATPGAPGVTHTLGGTTLGGFTITALAGANVSGGAPALALGPLVLTGNATLNASTAQFIQTTTTHPTNLGGNTLTVTGSQNTQLAIISNGPGFGSDALVKSGTGTLVLPNSNSTFQGDVEINGGFLRYNAVTNNTPLGDQGNTINLNGGALVMGATPTSGYTLRFNGGTIASVGANRDWNGQAAANGPSIIFTADTVIDLADPLAPATARDINFGLDDGTSGLMSSTGPVNISIIAPTSNATSGNRVRFRQRSVQGTVSGTVTVNQNAIFQIRGAGAISALGTSALRLDTGINLVNSLQSGRLEFAAPVSTNFGNHIEILGDSTIGVFTLAGGVDQLLTAGSLTIGANTLSVAHGSGNYDFAIAGTTTLTGNAVFRVPDAVTDFTLNAITESGGSFGFTKESAGLLRLNSPAGYTGTTTLLAGTLAANAPGALANAPLIMTAGTLGIGANNQSVTSFNITTGTVTGSGTLTTTGVIASGGTINAPLGGAADVVKTGAGTLTLGAVSTFTGDVIMSGGTLNLSVDNALPDTADVIVGPGAFNFHNGGNSTRNETIASLTVLSGGVIRTAIGTPAAASLITITGTLDVQGGDFVVNSASSVAANKVILGGAVQNVHIVGGNSALQVNELIVGTGGIEFAGSNLRMNTGDVAGRLGSRVVLNGDVSSAASVFTAGFFGSSAGAGFGIREISTGSGTRTFTIADGSAATDFRVQYPLVGGADLLKAGAGTMLLEAANTYTGNTIITDGTLMLTGSITGSPHAVISGGTLAGTGTAGGVILNGGTLAPGLSPGQLSASGVVFDSGTFAVEIFGSIPVLDYDRLFVSGTAAFTGDIALTLDLGFFDPVDDGTQSFTIVSTTGGVSGSGLFTFAGNPLSEGEVFTVPTLSGPQDFQITYAANAGNDIVLTAVPEPGSVVLLLGGIGLLARRRRA